MRIHYSVGGGFLAIELLQGPERPAGVLQLIARDGKHGSPRGGPRVTANNLKRWGLLQPFSAALVAAEGAPDVLIVQLPAEALAEAPHRAPREAA